MFTIEGDVWSFGIVLSEICSLGNNPYLQFRTLTGAFVDFLLAGGRMERGRTWPTFLHGLMEACWAGVPADRPTFAGLQAQLDAERGPLTAVPAGRAAVQGGGGSAPSDRAPHTDDAYVTEDPRAHGDDEAYGPVRTAQPAAATTRSRAQTAYRCMYRGANGQPCHNTAARGAGAKSYCRGHTCPHAGCTAPKRSGDSYCPEHAAGTGAKKADKGSKFQRGKQASVYLGFTSGGGGGDEGSTAV